ncbi:peptide-methionine (S)-S-oxide reductase MsrA [Legionella sp. CNM-4043-24]|uniref:peptide-methionine (S)-S-oxide reductase MsrA n=1 Tax=Legionella sp. CNM-4043-24 TaxID=3421646 RepID=UPI00403AC6C6
MIRVLVLLITLLLTPLAGAKTAEAIVAGGCFWCVQSDFDKLPGVIRTVAGYDGGSEPNPTYSLVSSGTTDYVESVMITYDPDLLSYSQLLNYFWHHIDPEAKNAQFCDHGRQYRSVIFYLNDEQKQAALASKKQLQKQFPIIETDILPSTHFYPAEEWHQNYYLKNPIRYKYYRYTCGRDKRIKELWYD